MLMESVRRLVISRTWIDEVLTWCHHDRSAGHFAFHIRHYKISENFFGKECIETEMFGVNLVKIVQVENT